MHLLRLSRNLIGQDYVVGDIHGHFDELERLLDDARFDPARDRLISVGDCIDRGPHSERAIRYHREPWFYSVRGNHEALLLGAQGYEPGLYEVWMRNGGEWAEAVSDELLADLADIYNDLPYVIEVDTAHGLVGVVHADLPVLKDWDSFTAKLEKGKVSDKDLQVMLWSRDSYRRLRMSMLYPGTVEPGEVEGVYKVYVGHSIVARPRTLGNMVFIDTGAYAGGQLSAIELSTERVVSVQSAPYFEQLA